MATSEDVRKWYNAFTSNQTKTGVNLRHYRIINYLKQAGLTKDARVLEIGCGIGTLTGLMSRCLRNGQIVATDISDESITLAKKRLGNQRNIEFVISDMSDFERSEKFDFVVLADVLEHIPIDQHKSLFATISRLMQVNGKLIIHIPHPKAIEYFKVHEPDKLQVIDQAVHADSICHNAYANNLLLVRYEAYSLFNQAYDYVFIELKLNQEIAYVPNSRITNIRKKFIERLKYFVSNH